MAQRQRGADGAFPARQRPAGRGAGLSLGREHRLGRLDPVSRRPARQLRRRAAQDRSQRGPARAHRLGGQNRIAGIAGRQVPAADGRLARCAVGGGRRVAEEPGSGQLCGAAAGPRHRRPGRQRDRDLQLDAPVARYGQPGQRHPRRTYQGPLQSEGKDAHPGFDQADAGQPPEADRQTRPRGRSRRSRPGRNRRDAESADQRQARGGEYHQRGGLDAHGLGTPRADFDCSFTIWWRG